ncbi:hypothetical protein JOD43_002437 [Pullulanibacillus pueri]|uniref:P68 RBP/TagC-like beta-propeller domain-containing protein n=1 Tax=Pullulanibacillus pueri TaxID=1437324 RepID=A0A8J3ELH5_9BACL|nr:hypothetical protein [Pullulanibacillus pueri]MBM7682262.1 hypothetical protein [Pullulanibacillus pueri]GGH81038.1 hypothetical protein GCM10007096_18340 [Pullulanibacillus pueri]
MFEPVAISHPVIVQSINTELSNFNVRLEQVLAMGKSAQDFDFTDSRATYFTTLKLFGSTVLQCMAIDEATGDIYATQVDNQLESGAIQSFRIVHLDQNGMMLDWMACKYGGHGTTFGIENEKGKVYIWSYYSNAKGEHKLVRFPYQPGTVIDGSTVKAYDRFTEEYMTPTIDQKNGTIAFRIVHPDRSQSIELRKLQDVKKGKNKVLATFTLPSKYTQTMQGMTTDGYDLYWYTGTSNKKGIVDPWRLIRFDMSTGTMKGILTCDFGRESDGKWREGFREPESIYLYTNPKTGQKSLFAGIVVGKRFNRVAKIFAFHQSEDYRTLSANNGNERKSKM